MRSSAGALALSLLPVSQAAETVLGVYMFHRHGDRTAKSTPPANLTYLGYQEVYTSGEYFRSRYIDASSPLRIHGISADIVKQSQIAVSAPVDVVLTNSAQGFLQGFYPPVGAPLDTQTLANGTVVTAPMDGYQLIPIATVSTGSSSENSAWLQSTTGCLNAELSSNEYFYTDEYTTLLNSTHDFYQSFLPVINGTFNKTTDTFKNAYTIFDLINVAEIHNATINSSDLITPSVFYQIRTLADTHEYNLAYNASSPIRAIAGMTLAAQINTFLNDTIASNGSNKIGVQFGSYGSFQSFFGLANLTAASEEFYGIPDYASVMTFELYTNASYTGKFPPTEDLQVRFLWHNGTTSDTSEPTLFPLFGQSSTSLSWTDFASSMDKISISTLSDWCTACGNSTGTCSPEALGTSTSSTNSSASGSSTGSHMSLAVAGVIGAMVTLGVILLVESAIVLLGGFRLVRKNRLLAGKAVANGASATKA